MKTFTDIVDRFLEEDPGRSVAVEWCPGHKDVEGNEKADKEAKAGARIWQARFVTLAHAKRRTKEKALEKWKAQWKQTTPTGGFAPANKLPPTTKPRKHVYKYARELFARLVQCRTKHSFIGEYYARFVPTESTACPCGENYQTREHILAECELHEEHRDTLREVDNDLEIGQLLGTEDGIKALAKFLTMTGAFTKTGTPRERERVKPTIGDDENDHGEERWWEWQERMEAEDEYTGRVEQRWEEETGTQGGGWE
ncbi:hypothetical protein H0H92_006925 [Tricholoma furcatifolium]|nr:hypothetical protein H0H92_006925 [Tricholoma furcatifolium]